MKRPSFQFYPKDWTTDLALRRCSAAARGTWIDVLCALHNSDDQYGLLRWHLKEIASTIHASPAHLRELVEKGVLRGSDKAIDKPLVYTPKSGRKEGAPVILIAAQPGPLWYSKRLVKDEYIRTIRGESTRFGGDEDDAPKADPPPAPIPPFGDGPTTPSSSASSPSGFKDTSDPDGSVPPGTPDGQDDDGCSTIRDGEDGEALEAAKKAATDDQPEVIKPPLVVGLPDTPHVKILALWAELMPELIQHTEWSDNRQTLLRTRWKSKAADLKWKAEEEGLQWFRRFFIYIRKSKFLMGNVAPRKDGAAPFQITLEWLLKANNFAKVIEGNYHPEG